MCMNFWPQKYLWTACFFTWYNLFVTTFLALTISCPSYILLILYIPFAAIWLLTVCSLYKCLFTRPPFIPTKYSVPQKILNLLTKRDAKDFCASETNMTASSSSSDGTPCNSSASDNEDKHALSKLKRRTKSKWELFYRQITELAKKRNLSVRTTPMTFGKETIQCPTICTRCNIVKPIRTHHCTRCAKCIARMDHHCPAIGKCVHLTNHKFFLIFLVYAVLLCLYAFIVMVPYLIITFMDYYETRSLMNPVSDAFIIPFAFSATASLQTIIFPIVLIWFQFSLWRDVLSNQTTLEMIEFDDGVKVDHREAYNLGSKLKNMESIFGNNRWLWFLPRNSTPILI